MGSRARVAIVDQHQMFRAGIVELLAKLDGVEVVGEAGSPLGAVELLAASQPDVVLMDAEMPFVGCLPGSTPWLIALRDVSPETQVVILAAHDDGQSLRALLEFGVSGYLLKSAGPRELYAAVAAATSGTDRVLFSVSRSTAASLWADRAESLTPLTHREIQVLGLVAEGHTNRLIARELHLAEATIKRHLATIYAKLDVHSRVQVVHRAQQIGILP